FVACPHCRASVAIPEPHREAFAKERREAETRTAAKELYAKLGAPPWYLRALGVAFDPSSLLTPLRDSRVALFRGIGWYYSVVLFVCGPMVMLLVVIVALNLTMRAVGGAYHQ